MLWRARLLVDLGKGVGWDLIMWGRPRECWNVLCVRQPACRLPWYFLLILDIVLPPAKESLFVNENFHHLGSGRKEENSSGFVAPVPSSQSYLYQLLVARKQGTSRMWKCEPKFIYESEHDDKTVERSMMPAAVCREETGRSWSFSKWAPKLSKWEWLLMLGIFKTYWVGCL